MTVRPVRLGRISRPIPHGVPTLRGHAMAREAAPSRLPRDHLDYRPALNGNDQCGDCTCVAVADTIRAQAALGGFQVGITTSDVLGLYRHVSGYPAQDDGAVEVDVLAYQARHGFAGDGQAPYVGLWANIEAGDLNLLRLVAARLGVGYLGVNLALSDQPVGVWDTNTPAKDGDPTPGSWGGHALCLWSYAGTADTDLVQLATWGTLQPATWRWVRSRLDEAHALVHPQMLGPSLDSRGVDHDRLAADVTSFGANA